MKTKKYRSAVLNSNSLLQRRLKFAALFAFIGLAFFGTGGIVMAHVEENDGFCASCHTQPESAYYQRALAAAAPVDLASAHTARNVPCIQCHSGAGVTGRAEAMVNVGAKDLLAYVTRNYHDPAIVITPITDEHCLKCHADVSQGTAFNNHFHRFLPKWQQADPTHAAKCVDCHKAHVTDGLAQVAFLEEKPTTAICQQCHTFAGQGG
jgi:predicted CXXCH cytochrome family protein